MLHSHRHHAVSAHLHSLLDDELHLLALRQALRQNQAYRRLMAFRQLLQAMHSHALAVNRCNLRQRAHAVVTHKLQLRTWLHAQHLTDMTCIHTLNSHCFVI